MECRRSASVSWSPNSKKMAVATADRVVHLYDETDKQETSFLLDLKIKTTKATLWRAMAFSPDN